MLLPPRYLLYLSTPTPEPRSDPAPATAAAGVTAGQDRGDNTEPQVQRLQQSRRCARSVLEAAVRKLTQTQGLQQAGSPEGPPAPYPLASVAAAAATAEATSPSVAAAAAAAAEPASTSDATPSNGNAVMEDDGRPRALQVGWCWQGSMRNAMGQAGCHVLSFSVRAPV